MIGTSLIVKSLRQLEFTMPEMVTFRHRLRQCATAALVGIGVETIVAPRSAKERSFAERRTTLFPASLLGIWLLVSLSGCLQTGLPFTSQAPVSNPLLVRAQNEEPVWERTVDVVHDYHFEISRENRLAHLIETQPRAGSGLLELWHRDSIGFDNRLESTLQSIRRRVRVSILPDDQGGFQVGVEAYKERESLRGIAANSPGAATFSESTPLQRDLNEVVGQSGISDWIPDGRDLLLEQAMLQSLRTAYGQ